MPKRKARGSQRSRALQRRRYERSKKGKARSRAANAKAIKRNRRAITALTKDTRETFVRRFNCTFNLIQDGPAGLQPTPGPNRVACLPIMPLCTWDGASLGTDLYPQSWGCSPPIHGLHMVQGNYTYNTSGTGELGTINTGQVTKWPVSAQLARFNNKNLNVTNMVQLGTSHYNKLRHGGTELRYEIRAIRPQLDAGMFPYLTPRKINVHMLVVSPKARIADALLRERGMMPVQWIPATTGGPLGPAEGNDNYDLTAGEDYVWDPPPVNNTIDTSWNFPEMNKKLWNVHSTRHMAFGYPTPVQATVATQAGANPSMTAQPFDVLSDEAMANSNWRKSGTLKFPAYGKMYDMQTVLGSAGDGVPQNARIEVPRDMDRNDVRMETQRFILIFCDGHGNLTGPDGDLKTNKRRSGLQLQMAVQMMTKYTASQGSQQ